MPENAEEFRECRACGISKPILEFEWRSDAQRRRRTCRDCRVAARRLRGKPDSKSCTVCGETKLASEFYDNQGLLRARCKPCELAAVREAAPKYIERKRAYNAAYYSANKPRLLQNCKEYRARNADVIGERRRAYYSANRLKCLRHVRRWYRANRYRALEWAENYRREHPEVGIVAVHRRRTRVMNIETTLTTDEWRDILEYHDHRCAYCLERSDALELEHVVAVARGGGTTADNVVPACRSCNAAKGARPVFWMATHI